MHETIIHNLMLLLECGAFDNREEGAAIVAMSPHKWRKLVRTAEALNVLPYIVCGAERMKEEQHLSPALADALKAYDENGNGKALTFRDFDVSGARLYNLWTQRKLEDVHEEEMNSPEISEDTLVLLDLIVANADAIITADVNIEGIIALGTFVREKGKNIDYDKLQQWLSHIGLVQLASLEGDMLIKAMHFSEEELPFVRKRFRKAQRLFMNPVLNVFKKHSFSTATRMDVAMLETLSNRFVSAISLITDIEE